MSCARDLQTIQYAMGIGYRPDHEIEEEATEALDADDFGRAALEVFQSGHYGDHSDEMVLAMAQRVAAQWQAEGRELAPNRNTAAALASEVGNRLSGWSPGSGMAALFGRGR